MKNKIILMLSVFASLSLGSCEKELSPKDEGSLVPRTVEFDPVIPSILVNGTRLHAEAFGNPTDPMVVFLHGGPGADYRNGLPVKNLVAQNYYVVFYDQRGSGLSKRHPASSYNIQLMLDDLTAVIQHYRSSSSQKVFLFGHSWGAMLATAYVNRYPAAIRGVILAEPGGFNYAQIKRYGEKSRKLKLFDEVTNDVLFPDQFLTGKENEHAILDYKLALASAFTYGNDNEEGIEGPSPFWRNGAAVAKQLFKIAKEDGFDFRTNLANYSTRVLFLYSQHNRAYGETFARELASAFPLAQVSQVDNTGHEMIWFGWNKVNDLVLPYLNSLR